MGMELGGQAGIHSRGGQVPSEGTAALARELLRVSEQDRDRASHDCTKETDGV